METAANRKIGRAGISASGSEPSASARDNRAVTYIGRDAQRAIVCLVVQNMGIAWRAPLADAVLRPKHSSNPRCRKSQQRQFQGMGGPNPKAPRFSSQSPHSERHSVNARPGSRNGSSGGTAQSRAKSRPESWPAVGRHSRSRPTPSVGGPAEEYKRTLIETVAPPETRPSGPWVATLLCSRPKTVPRWELQRASRSFAPRVFTGMDCQGSDHGRKLAGEGIPLSQRKPSDPPPNGAPGSPSPVSPTLERHLPRGPPAR